MLLKHIHWLNGRKMPSNGFALPRVIKLRVINVNLGVSKYGPPLIFP